MLPNELSPVPDAGYRRPRRSCRWSCYRPPPIGAIEVELYLTIWSCTPTDVVVGSRRGQRVVCRRWLDSPAALPAMVASVLAPWLPPTLRSASHGVGGVREQRAARKLHAPHPPASGPCPRNNWPSMTQGCGILPSTTLNIGLRSPVHVSQVETNRFGVPAWCRASGSWSVRSRCPRRPWRAAA